MDRNVKSLFLSNRERCLVGLLTDRLSPVLYLPGPLALPLRLHSLSVLNLRQAGEECLLGQCVSLAA